MTKKHELERMTYKEAEEAFAHNPVILIPFGSTEQHGPHAPVGDFRIAAELARRVAAHTGSVCAPVVPYSEGANARDFPGAVPIRPETLHALVWDLCQAFFRFNLDHILLFCGDHGNVPVLERLCRDIKDICGIRVAMVEQFRWLSPRLLTELYGVENPRIGHGGDPVTSLNMYLFPDDMRMDLAERAERHRFHNLDNVGFSQVKLGDVALYIPLDYSEISSNGVLGDIDIASAEVGARMLAAFVRIGVEVVEQFKQIDTRCDAAEDRPQTGIGIPSSSKAAHPWSGA